MSIDLEKIDSRMREAAAGFGVFGVVPIARELIQEIEDLREKYARLRELAEPFTHLGIDDVPDEAVAELRAFYAEDR